ncbi:histidine kinase dimerization/phospho-acceptor domain-containing protein [Butyrivibrio fibrisolvens]|uniref:histidine kinase dimerization/phospho-acceptor domain-containing protein n=1 Tax=Butyrivibrio fibrisolvens TaxID=831 RepID=UPI0004887DC6|nr:histidine kinase dimerization/phospho-acceptor domain-containing protein [Butyrivibrio fibrisolvens]
MSVGFKKRIRTALIAIFVLLVLCMIIQYFSITAFNSTKHTFSSMDKGMIDEMSDETSMDIHYRGSNTSTWIKRDMDIYGIISDVRVYNGSSSAISSWTLRVNVKGPCYINQFWNGDVEIHQHVGSDNEVIQTLNLANYDEKDIKLDYLINESDLLIPLDEGDYFVYYPEESMREMPIKSGDETVVGFIMYYDENIDLSDYTFYYYFNRSYFEGPVFLIICLLLVWEFFAFGMYLTAMYVYRKADREMELRKSGLSSMSGLYTIIYIVDLIEDKIIPVSYPEGLDKIRPRNLGANDQFKNLYKLDAVESYIEPLMEFGNLKTLPQRMENRNSISIEYVSKRFGWSRIRFINMDTGSDRPVEKVLFTIEQINEEKKEIDRILSQVEQAESKSRVKSAFLAGISREIRTPITVMLKLTDLIVNRSNDDLIRSYAKSVISSGKVLMAEVNSVIDYSNLEAGELELNPADYSLRGFLDEMYELIMPRIKYKGIEFQVDITDTIPDKMHGDSVRLMQILITLIMYTLSRNKTGGIRLGIFGKVTDERKVHLLISVKEIESSRRIDEKTRSYQKYMQSEGGLPSEKENEISIDLVQGLLQAMGAVLNVSDTYGDGNDYYFEIDQEIVERSPIGQYSLRESEITW